MIRGDTVEKVDNTYILITDSDAERCFTTDLGQMCKAYDTLRSSGARYVTLLRLHDWCALLPDDVLAALRTDVAAVEELTKNWGSNRRLQGVLKSQTPPEDLPGANGQPEQVDGPAPRNTYYVVLTWVAPVASAQQLFVSGIVSVDAARDFVVGLSRQLDKIYEKTTYLRPVVRIEKLAPEPDANGNSQLVLGDLGFDNFLDLPQRDQAEQAEDVCLLAELLAQLLDGVAYLGSGTVPPALALSALRRHPDQVRTAWPWEPEPPVGAAQEELWAVLADKSIGDFLTFASRLENCRLPKLAVQAGAGPTNGQVAHAPAPAAAAATAAVEPGDVPPAPAAEPPDSSAVLAPRVRRHDRLKIRIIDGTYEFELEQPLRRDGIVLLGDQDLTYVRYPARLDHPDDERKERLDGFAQRLKARRIYVQHHDNKKTGTQYYTITEFDPPRGAPRTLLNGHPLSPLFAALITNRSEIELGNGMRIELDSAIPAHSAGWIAAQDQGIAALKVDAPGRRLAVEPQLDSVDVPLKIQNPTQRVERLSIFVDGTPPDWPVSSPMTEPLFEKQSTETRFALKVPLARLAGEYLLTMRLISDNIGAQVAAEEFTLVVPPVFEFGAALEPETLREGEFGELHLHNAGNFARQFVVSWRDRANELVFDPPQTTVSLGPFSSGVVNYRADLTGRSRRWFGGEKRHEISVTAAPQLKTQGAPKTLAGQVVSRADIPAWAPVVVLLLLVGAYLLYTMLFPPLFTEHTVEVNGTPVASPIAGQPLVLKWDSANTCIYSVAQNGVVADSPQREGGTGGNEWLVADPRAGDKLSVHLRGCTFIRTEDWTVEVGAAPPATPTTAVAPPLTSLAAFSLRTQNVQTNGPGTGGAASKVPPEDQQLLLAGQTGELCIHWDVPEPYAKDVYELRLVTEPRVDLIERQGQIDQPGGEKCFSIAATFTDVITDTIQPKVYYIRMGAVEKATGNLASRSTETKVVQVFRPVCRVQAGEAVWIREGPGEEFAQRGFVQQNDEVFPLSSPLQLREVDPSGGWWVPVTLAGDPRPGWIAERYIFCQPPIDVLPQSSQVPATPTATPTASPTPTPLPTATSTPPPAPKFEVAPKIIRLGECAMLTWSIQNVQAVYLNGEGVAGEAEREVCPPEPGPYMYTWTIVNIDGSKMEKSVTLTVNR